MPRCKLKLAYITEEYARRSSLKKRRESLKKKLYELTTLCDVDACAIMYSPNESEAEVWPCEDGVKNVLDQLANVPEMDQTKKLFNHENYIKNRITKTAGQLNRQIKENREKEMANKISECVGGESSVFNMFIIKDLNDLESLASNKVSEIDTKLKELMKGEAPAAAAPPQSQSPQPQPAADGYVSVVENPGILHGIQTADELFREYWAYDLVQPYFSDHMHVGDHCLTTEDPYSIWSGASSSNATS